MSPSVMFPSTQVAALDTPILPSCPLHILGHRSIYFSGVCPPLPAAFASVQPSSSCPWGLPTATKLCPMLTSHSSQGIFLEQCLFKSRNVTISITQVPQSPIARPFLVFLRCHSFPHCFPHLLLLPQPLLHLSPKYDTPLLRLRRLLKTETPSLRVLPDCHCHCKCLFISQHSIRTLSLLSFPRQNVEAQKCGSILS